MRSFRRQAFANLLTGLFTLALLAAILQVVARDGDDAGATSGAQRPPTAAATRLSIALPELRSFRRQAFANLLTGLFTLALLAVILQAVARDGDDAGARSGAQRPTAVAARLPIASPVHLSRRTRQSGAVLTAWWHDNYSLAASDQSLAALAQTGANSVALLTTWYMANSDSSTIAPDAARTPTDASVLHAIATAQRLRLAVVLKPQVDVDTGSPRSAIDPADPGKWFAAYRRMLIHYADLAQIAHANMLVVGTELGSMSSSTGHWLALIRTARHHFSGELTYAAKLIEATRIRFWGALDFIGVNAYVPLTTSARPDPTVAQLVAAWRSFRDSAGHLHDYFDVIASLHRRYRRPVLFPELGYRSLFGTAIQPGLAGGPSTAGSQEPQRRAFEAAYMVWYRVPWFAGIYWWDWRARAFNPKDNGYNPRGKLAEQTMRAWNRRPGKLLPGR